MKKNPRVLALQRSQTKIFVEQSTMNKTLNKKGVYGNISAHLRFAKEHGTFHNIRECSV